MKLLDQNGRLFGKISIIDLIVVLAVVILCIAFYVKNNVLTVTSSAQNNVGITVVMVAELVPNYLVDAVQIGDYVYDELNTTGGPIGVITDIEYFEAGQYRELYDGSYAKVTGEDEQNFRITIEGTGIYQNGRYIMNRTFEIGANASRYFQSKYARFLCRVETVSLTQ
ncbi:MAG: DUF4330 domain-containing protein [Eubacteriales bacterium]